MTQEKKFNKKLLFGIIAIVAVIGVLAAVYFGFKAKPVAGAKQISIEVVDNEQKSTVYDVHTDAEFLRQAMDEANGLTYTGTESDYGMMVESVNGVTANYDADGAYWSFYINGEYCNYGIDTQPVTDGDKFQIKYEVAIQ